MRTVHISFSAMACCIWAAGALAVTPPEPAAHPRADTAIASGTITLPGEARAWMQTNTCARVAGVVSQWHVDIGDHVKQGQLLAMIDEPDVDARLEIAKARFEVARAELQVRAIALQLAKTNVDRASQVPAGALTQQEMDHRRAEFATCTAKLAAAEARVKLAEAEVTRAEVLASFKSVVAPFDGVINTRRIDVGDQVAVGTPLFDLAQSDRIRVFVEAPQKAAPQIQIGSPATVTSPDFPDRRFTGKVARAAQAVDPAIEKVRIELDWATTAFNLTKLARLTAT